MPLCTSYNSEINTHTFGNLQVFRAFPGPHRDCAVTAIGKHRNTLEHSPAMGGLQIPRWLGSDPLSAWWLVLNTVGSCTSHPGVLGSIPKREEPGKTGAPCVKVPGSSRVPPPTNSFVIGPAVINTHTHTGSPYSQHGIL